MVDIPLKIDSVLGYAIVQDGKLAIRTVMNSETGAMVNWLVIACNIVASNSWTDERVKATFAIHADGRKARCMVVEVRAISV